MAHCRNRSDRPARQATVRCRRPGRHRNPHAFEVTSNETTTEKKRSRSYWGFVLWPFVILALALLSQGCGTTVHLGSKDGRSGTFSVSYEDAKTNLNQMKPGTMWGRTLRTSPSEPVPGQRYVLSIVEGGTPPTQSTTEIK